MKRCWMRPVLYGVIFTVWGSVSLAQPPSPQKPEASSPARNQSQAAQPPQVQAAQPPQVRAARFGDWFHRCSDLKMANGETVSQCEVALVAQVKQGDEAVTILTLAIARTAAGLPAQGETAKPGLLLTALVPLNVLLPAGLGLATNGKPVAHIQYRNCNQAGCWAQQLLDEAMLNALKRAGTGEGQLRMMNGHTVNIRFSLNGLTAALKALEA